LSCPDRWDPAWGGFSDAGCPTLPSDTQEDPGIRAVWSVTLMESFWIGSPSSLAKSGGAIPGTRCLAPSILLLLESVVSRLLGHNRRPVVPGVQDPDKFHSQGSNLLIIFPTLLIMPARQFCIPMVGEHTFQTINHWTLLAYT
jgi:hypothetical protein